MKKLLIGTNLKMYKTSSQTEDFLIDLEKDIKSIKDEIDLFVIPSYIAIERSNSIVKDIILGAQNMHWEDEGQFTGEISPIMLKELGTKIIEIGHSERRHVIGEVDEDLNKKVLSALGHGFTALLCIGETEIEKDSKLSKETLSRQLKIGFYGVDNKNINNIWIAYEPVWAIGTNGKPASSEYAECMHLFIKDVLAEIFGEEGRKIPVLYGGSVNPDNASGLIDRKAIDGLFVGRAAWQADKFCSLINQVLPIWKRKQENLGENLGE